MNRSKHIQEELWLDAGPSGAVDGPKPEGAKCEGPGTGLGERSDIGEQTASPHDDLTRKNHFM